MFINNTSVREDAKKNLFLDRNITLTPQMQPSTPVDIRFYIRETEFVTLKNSVNSIGQPSGLNDITDLSVFNNAVDCGNTIGQVRSSKVTDHSSWETDYVLSGSTDLLSTFYFAKQTSNDEENSFSFYPNPVTDQANISVTVSLPERVTLKIIDNLGRILKLQQYNLAAGNSILSLDLHYLPKAVYYVHLVGEVTNKRKKFLKL
jgi:hypothetical protein